MGKQGEWLSVTGSAADYLWAAGFNWPAGGQCLKAASPQAGSCWCCQGPRPRVSVACRSACRRQQGNSVACYDACGRQQGMHSDMASCQAAAWVQPLTLSAQATQLPPSWKRRDESRGIWVGQPVLLGRLATSTTTAERDMQGHSWLGAMQTRSAKLKDDSSGHWVVRWDHHVA